MSMAGGDRLPLGDPSARESIHEIKKANVCDVTTLQ